MPNLSRQYFPLVSEMPAKDRRDIEDDAIKIEADLVAERNVGPVVAEKRWLDPETLTSCRNQFFEKPDAFHLLIVGGFIDRLAKKPCPTPFSNELRVADRKVAPAASFPSRSA